MRACTCKLCGWPALAWIALCLNHLGTLLGDVPGSPADETVEVLDLEPGEAAP